MDLDQQLVVQNPKEVSTKFSERIETFFFPVGEDLQQFVEEWVRYLREVLVRRRRSALPAHQSCSEQGDVVCGAGARARLLVIGCSNPGDL